MLVGGVFARASQRTTSPSQLSNDLSSRKPLQRHVAFTTVRAGNSWVRLISFVLVQGRDAVAKRDFSALFDETIPEASALRMPRHSSEASEGIVML